MKKPFIICKGKRELKHRNFGKVVGEVIELLKFVDYVYVFGSTDSFETEDLKDMMGKCETFGIVDEPIDRRVYELYRLREEELSVLEGR